MALTHLFIKSNGKHEKVQKYESLLTATDYKKVNRSQLLSADKLVELLHGSIGN